jgi:hypothetical protein
VFTDLPSAHLCTVGSPIPALPKVQSVREVHVGKKLIPIFNFNSSNGKKVKRDLESHNY